LPIGEREKRIEQLRQITVAQLQASYSYDLQQLLEEVAVYKSPLLRDFEKQL
jgi:hypothetical protein